MIAGEDGVPGPGATGIRLFVALELPGRLRARLGSWQTDVVDRLPALRGVPARGLHVTLCFLGWKNASQAEAIGEALGAVRAFAAPEMQLGAAVWLPRRQPRVLALEITDAAGNLAAVQGALSGRLAAGGWYMPERRLFRPHVTVARVRAGARAPRVELPPPPQAGFRGRRVTLLRSHLSPRGAEYEPLCTVGLDGGTRGRERNRAVRLP